MALREPSKPLKPPKTTTSFPKEVSGPNEASTSAYVPKPTKTSRPTWIWQPRKACDTGLGQQKATDSGKPENTKALIVSKSPDSTETKATLAPTLANCLAPTAFSEGLHRSWGSSSDWVLELRDGKRISIPLSLIRQPAVVTSSTSDSPHERKVLLLEGFTDLGSFDESNLALDEDGDEEDDVSVVWEDSELLGEEGALVC